MTEGHLLSKSTFLRGVRCQKSLMLDALSPERRDPLDADARLRLRLGQEVGIVARGRYTGGHVGRIPGAIGPSLQRTQELIEGGSQVIYEAAFQHTGVFIQVDILVKGKEGWRLIEVKSTTKVEEDHLWDVALQAYVLRGAGVRLEDTCLLHMNSDYVRKGELDLKELFTEVSVLRDISELEDAVEQSVASSMEQLALGKVPDQDIGSFCKEPRACDFKSHCWEHLPSPSVFDVYYIGKKAFDLYAQGITHIEKIPGDHPLDKRSRFHIEAFKSGETIIHQNELITFIEALDYPLNFLDVETFALPIPPFDGLSPYNKVPFQYSLHVQQEADGEVVHSSFLAEAGMDPRLEFLSLLLSETEGFGSIIVYYQSFERSVLTSLGEQYPQFKPAIDERIERFIDLWDPFRKQLFYTPAMGGSNSLKSVLPALVPEMGYEDLAISDGIQAMAAFMGLVEETDPDEIERVRHDLGKYCQLDTLAMVRILEELRKVCEC